MNLVVGAGTVRNAIKLTKCVLTVSNLERSYAFYSALGFERVGTIESPEPHNGVPVNQVTGSLVGTSFRNANLKIPETDFILEFVELRGQERVARHPHVQDPGASLLILLVRDVDTALTAVTKAGAPVVTPGGMPLRHEQNAARVVMVTDPDGFFVDLVQPDTAPAAKSSAPLAFAGRWATVVRDAESTARFYRDNLGFEFTGTEAHTDPFLGIAGVPNALILTRRMRIPGASLFWDLYEFQNIERQSVQFNVTDPGSFQFGLEVHDLDAAIAAFRSGSGTVISTGEDVGRRSRSGAGALVRDSDGVYLELLPTVAQ